MGTLLVTLGGLGGATAAAEDERSGGTELTLVVGEQQVISSEGIVSFSEGVEGVVDVRLTPGGDRFVVVGLRPGRTTLLLLTSRGATRLYRIEVRDPERAQDAEQGRVSPRHNVRLDFFFVQLDTSDNHDIGMRWPSQLGTATFIAGYDFAAGALTATTAVMNTALMPVLEMAQSRGWAKLLKQASVITATGTTADFSSGGEVNIPVVNAVSAGFEAIAFGSTVEVSPRYDADSGRIELSIAAEVSELSVSSGADVPGRSTASLHTLVNMELGQTLVLAGLSADSEGHSRSGLPGLSQIPILGGLFGKHGRRRAHTENVIYIVPSLVEATRAELREDLRLSLEHYQRFGGKTPPGLRPSTEVKP